MMNQFVIVIMFCVFIAAAVAFFPGEYGGQIMTNHTCHVLLLLGWAAGVVAPVNICKQDHTHHLQRYSFVYSDR